MALSREFKVGAFTLAGLSVVGFVVFMIGEERKLFESQLPYQAKFEEVQGLRRGSPVRMGGVRAADWVLILRLLCLVGGQVRSAG